MQRRTPKRGGSCYFPLFPGLPGLVPGPSLIGGFPGGCGSSPLPTPFLPWTTMTDCAIAGEFMLVESNKVIAGNDHRKLAGGAKKLAPIAVNIAVLIL